MVEQPTTYFSEHALSLPPPEQQQQLVNTNFQISNYHDFSEHYADFFSQVPWQLWRLKFSLRFFLFQAYNDQG